MNKNQKLYPFKFEADCPVLDENSIIINGFLSENSIDDVLDTYLGEIIGNDNFQYYKGIFPIKISSLKIGPEGIAPQLHPDNITSLERYMSMGKAKLWYVVKSTPETRIYLGFNKEMDATKFYDGYLAGTVLDDLHSFAPQVGEYIYIKPGYVHAVNGELEVIEISQNSEITYHLTGEDSDMEIAEAIDVVEYAPADENTWRILSVEGNTTIANTSGFIVKHIALDKPVEKQTQESFIVYVSLKGDAIIKANGTNYGLSRGEMVLVPAGMDAFTLSNESPDCSILEIYMPKVADIEEDLYMNYYEDESNYPTGSGTDPEEDDDEDECGCNDDECSCGHHHHHHHEHHHDDDMDDTHESHPGEFFFRR